MLTVQVIRSELKTLGIFAALSAVQSYLTCTRCNAFSDYFTVGSFIFFMWIFLWRGNELITNALSRQVSWVDFPVKRFLLGFLTTVVYTFAAVAMLVVIFREFFGFNFGRGAMGTIYASVFITILISLFLHGREFLQSWRKAAFDSERFQRESISARYESLKNQVNPSLLFHSLKTLSGMIHGDTETSVRFIKQLGDVYRYILDTRGKEIVLLSEEKEFLDAYFALLKARFGNVVSLRMNLNADGFNILPLAIHMIIESAIQNTRHTSDEPVWFEIEGKGGFVVITHQSAWVNPQAESGYLHVLGYISERYQFISSSAVKWTNEGGSMQVWLPLISEEELITGASA